MQQVNKMGEDWQISPKDKTTPIILKPAEGCRKEYSRIASELFRDIIKLQSAPDYEPQIISS